MDLRDAYALAEDLVTYHGLLDWSVEYDSAKNRAGVCRFATRTIGLSAPLTALHSDDDVRDTVLHEIAHALVGARHGHDEVWREAATRIGCTGERCVPAHAPRIEPAWLGVCAAGHTIGRHRRPERVMTCGQCCPTYALEHVFSWTHRGRPAVMHPNYDAELRRAQAGQRLVLLGVGTRARVVGPGEFHGLVGKVAKVGRTSYHLRAGRSLLRVPFAWVERA